MTRADRRQPYRYPGTKLTTRHLSDVIPSFMAAVHEMHQERHDLILAVWPQLVGPKIAQFTRTESFHEGVLKIKVQNSTLLSLLRQNEKGRLLAALRKKFPKVAIADIHFRMG